MTSSIDDSPDLDRRLGIALFNAPAQAVPSAHDGATSATKATASNPASGSSTSAAGKDKARADNIPGPLAKRAEQDRTQALGPLEPDQPVCI